LPDRFDAAQPVALQKTSLVDYPAKVAAVIFFPFCNLRCPWCHNGGLITGEADDLVPLADALSHIEKRRKVLGGVVLSGGEPTLFRGLGGLVAHLKRSGLAVKLDTNGSSPDVLEALLSRSETRPDFIAMDLKIAPRRYTELLPAAGGGGGGGALADIASRVERSARLVRASGVNCEFRSLRLPAPYFTDADIAALRSLAGERDWKFRPLSRANCLDPAWNN
jgi:pyruvate formate lyase activating enzyme